MPTTFPSGNDPYIFSDTLALNSTDTSMANLDAHINALNVADFSTAVPPGAASLFLTFVVFAYPNAANGSGTPPQRPIVEILAPGAGFDGPGTPLVLKPSGTSALPVGGGHSVNYTYRDLGGGVYQVTFTEDDVALDAVAWSVRFTVNDGVTGALAQTGLSFVVDSADSRAAWVAVPGQLNLPPTGPAPIDFGTALGNLTLSGAGAPAGARQIVAGKGYNLIVPLANYGTAPLQVTAVAPVGAPGNFTAQLTTPFTVAPGATEAAKLVFTYAAPAGGEASSAAAATPFKLTSNDPLAASSGPTAHFDTIALYATSGNIEIGLVLDLSGSMGEKDAGGESRWAAVQSATAHVMSQLIDTAQAKDSFATVLYPAIDGTSVGQVLNAAKPITQANADILAAALAAATPIDSTPMAGTAAKPGGIYTAAGKPTNPATDAGVFVGSGNPAFARNFRWMVLMSDGMSNVGDDPRDIPSAYYTARRIAVISVAYGNPSGGQVDTVTLKQVATASGGAYFGATPAGAPSQQLLMSFQKTIAAALGLHFAADPDAVLPSGVKERRHPVLVTAHDTSVSFLVTASTPGAMNALSVSLISPLGEEITRETAPGFGLVHHRTKLSRSFFAGARALVDPRGATRTGQWTIVVRHAQGNDMSGAPPADIPYAYSASVESELTLAVGSARPATAAGDEIELIAALAEQGRPIAGALVTAIVTGADRGFDNWLAAQLVSPREYTETLRSLEQRDVQAIYVKTLALARRGIVYPGGGGPAVHTLTFDPRTGTYRTRFTATQSPGSYQFLVTATGVDDSGATFTRQRLWDTVAAVRPSVAGTIVSISYQRVGAQIEAVLRVWPQDVLGNVFLIDPQVSAALKVLLADGATATGPLRWNLDASYSQAFTFPPDAAPVIAVTAGGVTIVPKTSLPVLGKLRFVDTVVAFRPGRTARPDFNRHVDPAQALGDPSLKPLTSFVSLGGLGVAEYAVKGDPVRAVAVTVFVAMDSDLRAYAVDVLPARAGAGWIEVGRSRGVTQRFGLTPARTGRRNAGAPYITVEGRIEDASFDVRVPLAGKLHYPTDPLDRIGDKGIAAVRIRDLSDRVTEPDGSPSASPGVSLLAIGFQS